MVAAGKMTVARWQWKGEGRRSPLIPSLSLRQNPVNTSGRTQALSGNRGGRKGHEAGNSMPARRLNRSTEVTSCIRKLTLPCPAPGDKASCTEPALASLPPLLDQRPLSKGHMPALELGGGMAPEGLLLVPRIFCLTEQLLFTSTFYDQAECEVPYAEYF